MFIRCLTCIAALLIGPAMASPATPVDQGQRLYREGMGVDGRFVSAVVQGDVPVNGAQLACAGCHKRSGLGTSEGGVRALPITAAALFDEAGLQPDNLLRRRPAYSEQSLRNAIASGLDPDGRDLDSLMPRYRLDDRDMSALIAYLKVLGTEPAPGVGADDIEIATIVSVNAPAHEREAVSTVVQRFAGFRNGATRNEQRRAEASRRHPYGERHARAFRKWHVSIWTLTGTPDSWTSQLEALYARRPPFAVISGAAGDDWLVVDEFCERKRLPCVLPVTDMPHAVPGSFYSVYYSAGVQLEARVTAKSIDQGRSRADGKVLLLHTDDARGEAARDAFLAQWPRDSVRDVVTEPVHVDRVPTSRDWNALIERTRPAVVVAWLGSAQLQSLATVADGFLPPVVYTAASFTDWSGVRAPDAFEKRVVHVYPYSLPESGLAQFPREQVWLKSQGLAHLDTRAAAKALFACHAVGEAMLGMADNYSRDYLVETLEHMLDDTSMTSLFPLTTLAPGQRFLVKGAYVTRLSPPGGRARYVSNGWIQP